MFKIKRHLDTACFSIADPKAFAEVKRYLARYERDSSSKLKSIAKVLRDSLQPTPCVIRGRFKEPYSVYKKFREKAYRSLASIHDLFAFRIILASQNEKEN
jgi:(p)ppGpp synthase/HD superfamily hydrolase